MSLKMDKMKGLNSTVINAAVCSKVTTRFYKRRSIKSYCSFVWKEIKIQSSEVLSRAKHWLYSEAGKGLSCYPCPRRSTATAHKFVS